MQTIQLSEINELDRQRQEYTNIEDLAASIMANGLIQPIVVSDNNTLIAGGRRKTALQAILNADLPDDAVPASVHPTIEEFIATGTLEENVHFRRMEMFDDSTLSTLELEENLQRENLTWQETALGIARVHSIKTKQAAMDSKSWGVRETARLLGGRFSKSHISYVTRVAKLLQANDNDIWNAENLTAAWKIITQRKANEAATEFAKRNVDSTVDLSGFEPATPPQTTQDGESASDELTDDTLEKLFGGKDSDKNVTTTTDVVPSHEENIPVRTINFSEMFYNTDMIEAFTPESVDHIITDPPYGIDMANLKQSGTGMQNVDQVAHTHDVEDNLGNFFDWFNHFHTIVRPGGFCVVWCDMMHFNRLYAIATKVGFKVQRWPLVWVKTHTCMNQAATKNFTKTIEVALLCRKGNAVLVKPQHSCVHMASNEAERKQFQGHPFVKPFTLWRWVANAIAIPGQTIADPFCGAGSMPYALLSEGFKVTGAEIDTNHYNQLREKLTELYARKFPTERVVLK